MYNKTPMSKKMLDYTTKPLIKEYGKIFTKLFEFVMGNSKRIEVHAWTLIYFKRKWLCSPLGITNRE